VPDFVKSNHSPTVAEAGFERVKPYGPAPFAEDGIGFVECWLTIRKRLTLITVTMAVALLLALIAILFQRPRYTATATLLIQPETPQVLDVAQLFATTPSSDEHDFYKTQEDLLRSPALAAKVIRTLGLGKSRLSSSPSPIPIFRFLVDWPTHLLGSLEASHTTFDDESSIEPGVTMGEIDRYLKMLEITPILGSQLINVSFTTTDPLLAARIANAHARCFIDWGLELRHEASSQAQDFLRGQLVEIKERVESSEAALNNYRHSKGIISFTIDDKDQVAETRMNALSTALTEAETERIRLEAEMRLVRAGDYDSLPAVISNQMIETLKPRIDDLAGQYAAMSSHFTDRWPDAAKLKAQLAESRVRLSQEVANVAKGISRQYQAALTREQELHEAVDEEKERDLARNDAALQDAVLERAAETKPTNL
jgi:uncharacterized protein involved in exopolysaccharide biosynthesis